MATIIRLVGLANGTPTAFDGQYVVSFDPAKHNGRGDLVTSKSRAKARRFPTTGAAIEYYRQAYGVRTDGYPNRPLTAFSAEFLNLDHIGPTGPPLGKETTLEIIDDATRGPGNG